MGINFTDSPADGATQVISGRTYTYNSAKNKWDTTATEVVGPTATVYATVDNLPGTATTGDQAFVSGTNRLYIWNGSGWYNIALINNTPTISGVSSSYALATDGTATTVTITATDPEGLPITYSIASDTSGDIATVAQGTGANTNVFTITPSTSDANAGTFSLTFRASDGVNIASSIASFTLQFSVQNQKYTTALITTAGNAGINNSFTDSSGNSHTVTVTGDATQNTFSPYRHGGYSTYFDGSDSLSVTNTGSTLAFGTGDVTVEGWINQSAAVNTQYGILADLDTSGAGPVAFWYNGTVGTGAEFRLGAASIAHMIGFRADTPINEWFHFAYVRESGTWKFYLNGTESTTRNTDVGDADGYSFASFNPNVASFSNGLNMLGYMRDIRVVNGTAVYTSNFTPPTERLTAITNTALLTCHLPYIADGSTNSHAITVNGNPTTKPFAPYDTQEYTAGNHGGSLYLDGTGDRLSVGATTDLGFGTGDFTIEYWIKHESKLSGTNYPYAFDMRSQDNDAKIALYHRTNVNNIVGIYVSASTIVSGTNQMYDGMAWVHYAVCKTGGYLKGYFNGKQDFSVADSTDYGSSGQISIGGTYSGLYHMQGHIADFRVVKGTAVYTGEFTPPTAPLSAITNTSLLLGMQGAKIFDKAQTSPKVTLYGNTTASTSAYKYLPTSIYFDGTDDYIALNDQDGSAYGTGDFTLEAWVYLLSNPSDYNYFLAQGSATSGTNNFGVYYSSNALKVWHNSATAITGTNALSLNTWHHIALSREGTSLKLFLDGTQEGSTATNSSNITSTATGLTIGRWAEIGDTRVVNGYMSDVRVTKGLARYTANFTPPTAALKG